MQPWVFYPAFLGTIISMLALTRIAVQEHDHEQPRTLSELAAAQDHVLRHFQKILWLCGTLFAITIYGFIAPRVHLSLLTVTAWTLTYIGEMLLAVIPARDKRVWLHNFLAESMGAGMLALAYTFWVTIPGAFAHIELVISTIMTVLGAMTILDKKRFIFYELPFIYLSHISILVAAFSLR